MNYFVLPRRRRHSLLGDNTTLKTPPPHRILRTGLLLHDLPRLAPARTGLSLLHDQLVPPPARPGNQLGKISCDAMKWILTKYFYKKCGSTS